MSSPTPQDFKNTRNCGHYSNLECDYCKIQRLESEKEDLNERVLQMKRVMNQQLEILESEKSLLEKRVRELSDWKEQAEKGMGSDKWLPEEMANMQFQLNDLKAENERLKAEVVSRTKEIESLEKIGRYQPHVVEILESRLAEAVRIMRETLNSFCECLDGSGKVETSDEFGNTEIYRCPCSKARDFLNSPTTSKALEIARAKDAVVESAKKLMVGTVWQVKDEYDGSLGYASHHLGLFVDAISALDALTSEGGKV